MVRALGSGSSLFINPLFWLTLAFCHTHRNLKRPRNSYVIATYLWGWVVVTLSALLILATRLIWLGQLL